MHILVGRHHKALRQKAAEVSQKELKSATVKEVIRDMKKALRAEEDGVAIAAPQVGVPLRIFVVSGKVFALKRRGGGDTLPEEGLGDPEKVKHAHKDLVFVNPRIIKTSKDSDWMVEGCLSLRWLYGSVERKKKVTIEAVDEKGEKFTRGASGLLAQIFQHEIDHLEGALFIDKARDVEDIPPELQKAEEERRAKSHAK